MKFDTTEDEIKIYDFNALQALKIGRHLETEGIDFYNKLLRHEKISDYGIRDGIEFLLQEEKKHLQHLEEKIDEMSAETEDGFEEEDLEDFINTKVFSNFNNLKNVNDYLHSIQDTMKLGIMVEKRSIMFFKALLEHEEDESGKKAINEMIAEETEHLVKLKELIKREA